MPKADTIWAETGATTSSETLKSYYLSRSLEIYMVAEKNYSSIFRKKNIVNII